MTRLTEKKRRILLLTEQYYPLVVPGAFRAASFAKYLPRFGFEPVLIAPDWTRENVKFALHGRDRAFVEGSRPEAPPETHRHPVATHFDSRLTHLARSIIAPQIPRRQSIKHVVKLARKLHAENPFDLLLACGAPHYLWVAGRQLSKETGIPWVADVRDVSGQFGTANINSPLLVRSMRKLYNQSERFALAEARLIAEADLACTVSQPLAELLESRGTPNVKVILNGFDEDDYTVPAAETDKFRIVHAGSIHSCQSPSILLNALDRLLKEIPGASEDIELLFYGDKQQAEDFVDGRRCKAVMHGCRTIPKPELIPVMKSAAILLHLSVAGAKGIMTSKVTEYLAAAAPILTVPGDGDVVDALLRETGAGQSCGNVESAFTFLMERYQAWAASEPQRDPINTDRLQEFSRRRQCEKLATHLTQIFNSNPRRAAA